MRRDVDVEPGEVHAGTRIHCDGAEEGAKEFDGVGHVGEDDGVADNPDEVGEEDEGGADREAVRSEGEGEEAAAADNVDGDSQVLGLKRRVAHRLDDRGKEGGEAVEENVLAELNEAAVEVDQWAVTTREEEKVA